MMNENLLFIAFAIGIIVPIILLFFDLNNRIKLSKMIEYNVIYSTVLKNQSFEYIENDGVDPCEEVFDLPCINYFDDIVSLIDKDEIHNAKDD